jgi:hypothetical protein
MFCHEARVVVKREIMLRLGDTDFLLYSNTKGKKTLIASNKEKILKHRKIKSFPEDHIGQW